MGPPRPSVPRPDITAATRKAKDWLSHGNPEAMSTLHNVDVLTSKSTLGSGTSPLPAKPNDDKGDASDTISTSGHGKAPSIIPKESGRKVESPKDENAPSPKPLSTIEVVVTGSNMKKRARGQSTVTITSLPSWGNHTECARLALRDQAPDSYNDWGNVYSDALPTHLHGPMCVSAWIDDVADAPGVDMSLVKYQDPDTRDIDTFTGDFAERYEYPHTMKNPEELEELENDKATWRRDNMTAILHMKHKEAAAEMQKVEAKQIEAFAEARRVAAQSPVVEWPAADCLLRPVLKDDYGAVAGIMNAEASDKICPQTINSEPVNAVHVEELKRQCDREHYPFIVAVSNNCSLLDRLKWPKGSEKEYQEYVKFKSSQPHERESVLGFAYITASRTGFSGTPCHGSRHSGEIRLLVHPENRRNLVGTALLDRILMSVDICHRSLVDHEWQCNNPKGVYEKFAINNHRQYAWVEINTFCRPKDAELLASQKSFVDKYGFELRSRLEEEVKLERGRGSAWLDVICWRLTVRERREMADRVYGLRTGM